MKRTIRSYAKLIYEEFIEWTLDYIEDEVSFDTTLINLEKINSKIYSKKYDIESQFLIDEFEVMESILMLFLIASLDYDEENNEAYLETKLKKELTKLINESEGEDYECTAN